MFRRYSHLIPPPPQLWSLLAPYASARIHCSRNFVIECISPVLIRKKFFHYESTVLFALIREHAKYVFSSSQSGC